MVQHDHDEALEKELKAEESKQDDISAEEVAEEVEVIEEPAVEVAEIEEAPAEPEVPVKKPFKLDLSKIDFADEETPAPAPAVMNTVEVAEEEPEEDKGSISFKNFFKKK